MSRMWFLGPVTLLALFSAAPAQPQEPAESQSVVEAARNARQHTETLAQHAKIFTNADLEAPPSANMASTSPFGFQPPSAAEASKPAPSGCDNPEAARLAADLQAAQQQLAELSEQLSSQSPVISDNDLDLQQFRPGSSGLIVGTPPLLDSEPTAPARVTAVELQETIDALTKALRTACEPPEAAAIHAQLDSAEQQLDVTQRELALDQDTFYSSPDYAGDSAGQARIESEQQQIQDLQSQVEELRQQLAALIPSPPAE